MKYFDTLTEGVKDALVNRGVDLSKLLYCLKCDMDGEGLYYDTYLAFDSESLYIVSGYDRLGGKKEKYRTTFDFKDYKQYGMTELTELYVDRYRHTCRLMGKKGEGEEAEKICISRFSSGFSEKAEQFCRRYQMTVKHEEIDDTPLAENSPYCPKCGQKYPDPNRKFCPYCVKKSSIFKRLVGLFGEYKGRTAMIVLMMILSAALAVLSPYFSTTFLYDEVLNSAGEFYGKILYAVIAVAGVKLLSMLLQTAYGIFFTKSLVRVMHNLRVKVYNSMQHLSLPFFTSKQTGSLMSRVDGDAGDVSEFFANIIPSGIVNIVKLISMTVLMFMVSPLLALCVLGMIGLVALSEVFFIRGQRRLWRGLNLSMRTMNSNLNDSVNGHRVIKAFAREEQEIARFGKSVGKVADADLACHLRGTRFEIGQEIIFTIGGAILTAFGYYLVVTEKIGLGDLMLMTGYFGMMIDPMYFMIWAGDDLSRCLDAASRVFEIMDNTPTVKPPQDPVKIGESGLKGDIELKNVSFEYEAGVPVLKNLSMNIEAGKFYGIVGKTGAGKSTLINLISRLYDPTNGTIAIDGINIRNIAFEDLRRSIGIVSQETYIFMGTVADNIRYARPDASLEEVVEAAKSANAHDFILKLPDGYDTVIGSGGADLSGGERQRISIARALIQKPNILILDEATASMDTRTERKIQNAVENLKKGRTVIAIAHRLSTLRDADMLCVIENGEVKETGTHEELIHKKGKYFDLYKLQAEALKTICLD
ncbi:MAG: ATP-binding cassette domain-containing protein [Firmicutes bacterium]|nr:ATP-binding cassette domain-containing protein [[Eubacterium] siraeum]MCM1488884.1 ATP-binding cassette domain-containing protein [Bacillota bacterium]